MRLERKHQQLATVEQFIWRMVKYALVAALMVCGSLWFGAWGYEQFAGLKAVDAWHAAAMILFSEGPVARMCDVQAKIWETFYSAFSGVAFFSIVGTFLAPIIHRFFHHFHLDGEDGR